MIIKNIYCHELALNFNKVTQICVIDIQTGHYINSAISEYFSSFRYTDDDIVYYNHSFPEISTEDQQISRNQYKCININSYLDIDNVLLNKKDSLLYQYNKMKFEDIELQKELEQLEYQYLQIHNKIINQYNDHCLIQFKDININSDFILGKNLDCYIPRYQSCFEKIKQIIDFINEISAFKGQQFILYLNNVDNYINKEELICLKDYILKTDGIYLIIQTQNTHFLDYSCIEEINFVLESSIESLPDIQTLLDKANLHLKHNELITREQIIRCLEKHVSKLFTLSKTEENMDSQIMEALKSDYRREGKNEISLDDCIII